MKGISFREDVLPLKDKLFRLALSITQNRTEAEDVVQETLIRIWNHRDDWEQIESLEGYSLTICRRLALDEVKKASHGNVPLDVDRDADIDDNTPHGLVVAEERREMVRRQIDRLPEMQRSIMLLRHIEGKSYHEIAEILKLSESQVKVYLHRARQRMKEQIIQTKEYGL